MTGIIHLDFETYSECDLKACGMYRYAEDLSTEILCLSYAFDEEEPELWTPYDPEPARLFKKLRKSSCRFAGLNVSFELLIWEHVARELHGWPRLDTNKAIDVAAIAAMHALPRSLAGLSEVLDLKHKKDKAGEALIRLLCKPRKPTKKDKRTRVTPEDSPEKFTELYEYCKQDVRAEREVFELLGELPRDEQELWLLDNKINGRGVLLDQAAVKGAIAIHTDTIEELNAEAAELSGGAFETTNQRQAVMDWSGSRGFKLDSYTIDYLRAVIKGDKCPPEVKRILQVREMSSRTSVKKFYAMDRSVCSDGTIKGMLLYHGATTGRWTGKLVQLHSMTRPTIPEEDITLAIEVIKEGDHSWLSTMFGGDPLDTMTSCIRGCLLPNKGKKLYAGDFSNVEGRVLMWHAEDQQGLGVFREDRDLYLEMASSIYDMSYEELACEYKGGQDDKRRVGKLAILGLGYSMGADKFQATSKEKGVDFSTKFAQHTVDSYRNKFKSVTRFWKKLESAAGRAILEPGKPFSANKVSYCVEGMFLVARLPSGRKLFYASPMIVKLETPWGGTKDTITYMVSKKGKWMRTKTFGGKMAENVCQASSRDLLVNAMLLTEKAGYETVFTVHDEIVSEHACGSEKEFKELMVTLPAWAEGAPIEADTWCGERYKK